MLKTDATLVRVDDAVRLTRDIPELSLRRGDLGVVISTWCAPHAAYEVEFDRWQGPFRARVLLLSNELTVEQHRRGQAS